MQRHISARASILTGGALLLTAALLGPAASATAVTGTTTGTSVVAPQYEVVTLGVLRGDEYSVPYGINAAGDVVGWSGGQVLLPMPFRYTDATGMKRLRMPDGTTAGMARDINNDGFVIGHVTHSPADDEAVRWAPGGRVKLLGALGTPHEASSYGHGINDKEVAAGWSYITPYEFGGQEAFKYTKKRGMVSVTPGARPGFGYDINATGQISGEYEYNAVRITGKTIVDISGSLAGNTSGDAINAGGQVAITQTRPDLNDAWRWTPGVGLEDLGLAATDEATTANGINSAGDVVGRGRPSSGGGIMGGYLFRDGLGSIDLNDLLVPADQHWYISEAFDINDSGQIVAFATNLETGNRVAVRLDPVP